MLVCFLKKINSHLKQPSAFEFRMFEYSNVIIKLFPKPEINITAHESSSNTACGVLHYSSSVRSIQTQFTKNTNWKEIYWAGSEGRRISRWTESGLIFIYQPQRLNQFAWKQLAKTKQKGCVKDLPKHLVARKQFFEILFEQVRWKNTLFSPKFSLMR